jgi:hypothetical protein
MEGCKAVFGRLKGGPLANMEMKEEDARSPD